MSFFRKKVDVLNHWIAFADGFQCSPSEFYASVEQEVAARSVPKMEMSRIDFPEGGLLSEKRVYLRMLRERLVFDICAAPFGSGFFFSCRTAEIPRVLSLWQMGFTIGLTIFILYGLVKILGTFSGLFAFILVFATAFHLLRNTVALGFKDLDKELIQSPLFGTIYEVFFRKETYYRIDSRLCYLEIVPTIVRRLAEDATGAKGVKLVRQYELSPILGDLYKPAQPSLQVPKP